MAKKSGSSKIKWHRLLGGLLEELLTPVDILVFTEFAVMSQSPVADILLLRKKRGGWTSEQLQRVPDGIRDTNAKHILIEFKYTESVDEDAFKQLLGYEYFYRSSKNIAAHKVQSFMISSKTPRQLFFNKFGYSQGGKKGVYYSSNSLLKNITLVLLNELSDDIHNAFIKCFASHVKSRESAFKILTEYGLKHFNEHLQWFIQGLWRYWFTEKGGIMEQTEITPAKIKEMGKMWGEFILSTLPVEERLKGLRPEEVLSTFRPEERLKGLKPKVIEAYLRKIAKNN